MLAFRDAEYKSYGLKEISTKISKERLGGQGQNP
jgi:hypothetical protein